MKKILFILAVISLTACCNSEECKEEASGRSGSTLGPTHNYQTPTEFVSDEIFLQNKEIMESMIDSLETVEKLPNE